MATFASASTGLFYAHIPLDEPTDLALGVTAFGHPRDELAVLLFGLAVLLRTERDHRKQVFDLRKDPLLDHIADLLVAGPARILAAIVGPRSQRELDDLVAEILRVGDAGGLLDLGQLLVQKLAIEPLAGIGILEVLILDPGVSVVEVAVEEVLAVIRIGFEIGLLDLVADELGIARTKLSLDEFEVTLLGFFGKRLATDCLFQSVHQMDGIGAKLGSVVVERRGANLERKARRDTVHAFVHARNVLVFLDAAGFWIGLLSAFAVIDPHLGKQRRVLVLAQA